MKSARRNRSVKSKGTRNGAHRPERRRVVDQLETLESRVLLSVSASTVNWNGHAVEAVAGQYIVASPLSASQLQAQLLNSGLHPTQVKSLGHGVIGGDTYLVVDNTTPVGAVNWWAQRASSLVTSFTPNIVYRASMLPFEYTQQPYADALWPYYNPGTLTSVDPNGIPITSVAGADIGMANAWDLGTGDRKYIVAVLDSGIDLTHPDLVPNIWRNTGDLVADLVDNDSNGVVDDNNGANFTTVDATTLAILPDGVVTDVAGHGTFVSGIIGAVANNAAEGPSVGINWNVQIMPVKVLDDTGVGTAASIIAGLNYVLFMKQVKGFNIIAANLSLGGGFEGPLNGIADPTGVAQIFVTLNQLNNQGVIVTAAAGNEGSNNDVVPVAPANYNNKLFLTVTSTNPADQLSPFSNTGSRVQIAAPGDSLLSTIPVGATDFVPVGPTGIPAMYSVASGTSFASPMVAGAAALLKSIVPGASPTQIVNAILAGVDVLPQLAGKVSTSGRLNVFRSAEILLGNRPVIGNVEVVSASTVAGWAFDPNLGVKPASGSCWSMGRRGFRSSPTSGGPTLMPWFITICLAVTRDHSVASRLT